MSRVEADRVYREEYQRLLNTGAVGLVSRLTHKSLEFGIRKSSRFSQTLELGAGHGQHLGFVKHAFDKYFETDIRQENLPKRESNSIIQLRVDAGNLSGFDDYSFDRLIASCVIFHLSDPETALREWRRVLKVGGRLDFYVPSEPGALLRLLRSLTTVRKAKRMGLDHYAFHYREHRFSYPFIHTLIKDVFQADSLRISSFPVPWTSWNASLWKVVRVTKLAKLEESKRKG